MGTRRKKEETASKSKAGPRKKKKKRTSRIGCNLDPQHFRCCLYPPDTRHPTIIRFHATLLERVCGSSHGLPKENELSISRGIFPPPQTRVR